MVLYGLSSHHPVPPLQLRTSTSEMAQESQTTTLDAKAEPSLHLPRITIAFCTQCKWMLRAAYVRTSTIIFYLSIHMFDKYPFPLCCPVRLDVRACSNPLGFNLLFSCSCSPSASRRFFPFVSTVVTLNLRFLCLPSLNQSRPPYQPHPHCETQDIKHALIS